MSRQLASVALLLGVACGGAEEPLPTPHQDTVHEPCDMPEAAPMMPILSPTDPARCLPSVVRRRGLTLHVGLSSQGKAIAVSKPLHLCVVLGPSGEPEPDYDVDAATAACILRELRPWRFMTVQTCAPLYGYVTLGGDTRDASHQQGMRQSAGQRGHWRGGPTSGCS